MTHSRLTVEGVCTQPLPWDSLIFGSYSHDEVKHAVNDISWQTFRSGLLCMPARVKFDRLAYYVNELREVEDGKLVLHTKEEWKRKLHLREVRVTNYVNALRRGGLIPSE